MFHPTKNLNKEKIVQTTFQNLLSIKIQTTLKSYYQKLFTEAVILNFFIYTSLSEIYSKQLIYSPHLHVGEINDKIFLNFIDLKTTFSLGRREKKIFFSRTIYSRGGEWL